MGSQLDTTFEYVELVLDSADAVAPGSTTFKNPASNGSGFNPEIARYSWPMFNLTRRKWKVAALKVLEASIPYIYDNINNGNNSFIYIDTGVEYLLRIPEGVYTTGASVAMALQTLIQTVRGGFTVTFSSLTNKFTFAPPGAFLWGFTFSTRDTAYSVMGFLPMTTVTNVGGVIISKRVAEWNGSKYLYLNSKTIGPLIDFVLSDDTPSGGLGNQIAKIPVIVGNNNQINYVDTNTNNFFDFFAYHQFDNIDLYLTPGPSEGQLPLDLRGASWSVKLGILVYRNPTPDLRVRPSYQKHIK